MLNLSPRVFKAVPGALVGVFTPADTDVDYIGSLGVDSDDPEINGRFEITVEDFSENSGDSNDKIQWNLIWTGEEIKKGTYRFNIPIYAEYVDKNGLVKNWKGSFVVYAKGETSVKPVVQYVDNLATRVDTTEQVTVYGYNFNDDLDVFLERPDGSCVKLTGTELYRTYGDANGYDSISFIFGDPYVLRDGACNEVCGLYAINLGYGVCGVGGNSLEAGTGDPATAWENDIYLIRYKFDSVNKAISDSTPGGLMTTVDAKCMYTSDMTMVYDRYDSDGKPRDDGGVYGSLGKTVYVKIKPDMDCTKMAYYRVKLKYSKPLPSRSGEMVLDGVSLEEGDLVWLDKQFDGSNGLWIVQSGEWIGLKTYLDNQVPDPYVSPCAHKQQEPLPVDDMVIADLGVRVDDKVTVACDSDVPVKYGSQKVCGRYVNPGDVVLLSNQSDGGNGVWEVTCADWYQRSSTVPPHSGTAISGDDAVIVQNDIDFCACSKGNGKNIFHIWYYYLNGSCYLSQLTRTVKIICNGKGNLFPSNKVNVTDYSVTVGVNNELVTDSHRTAGDPVKETCAEKVVNYDVANRVNAAEHITDCGTEAIYAPNGMLICRCNRVYTIGTDDDYTTSRDRNGFSVVFWQYDEDDDPGKEGKEGWHLYAYVGAGRYDIGMNYYVYHLYTKGIAQENDVEKNIDIEYIERIDGRDIVMKTADAWFVPHISKFRLAKGFGLVDDSWNFKVEGESGEPEYIHNLDFRTLYSMWSVKCTTVLCATRDYSTATEYTTRTSCQDMEDVARAEATVKQMVPTPDTWGFKYYKEAVGKSQLCDIWNSMPFKN